jgi:hypothetical protein
MMKGIGKIKNKMGRDLRRSEDQDIRLEILLILSGIPIT